MSDVSIKHLIQREKWRRAKAEWRAKAKSPSTEKVLGGRRHARAKLTLDEELFIFGDYLQGDSYRVLCKRYSLSIMTINKILSYWKGLYEDRFDRFNAAEHVEEEPIIEQSSEGGFF